MQNQFYKDSYIPSESVCGIFIRVNGLTYLQSFSNRVYDVDTKEQVGFIYNGKIDFYVPSVYITINDDFSSSNGSSYINQFEYIRGDAGKVFDRVTGKEIGVWDEEMAEPMFYQKTTKVK